MKLIDADALLETIETYTPSLGSGASPGFVAGVYYCLHHVMPIMIRAAKTEAEDMELANRTIEEMRRNYECETESN